MALIKKITKVFKHRKSLNNQNHKNNSNLLPNYLIIGDKEKEKLIYSISVAFRTIEEQHNVQFERKEINIERDKIFKNTFNETDKIIELIKKSSISIVASNEIYREIGNLCDKNNHDSVEKLNRFIKKVPIIVNNIDNDFLSLVAEEYNVINYVTISTVIIDKNDEVLKKLENDYAKHRFNKSYYEREINNIKHELKSIKDLKSNQEVSNHITLLKRDLYTKSIDKYDLLYSNDYHISFTYKCDSLLNRINAKVIDLKKDTKPESSKHVQRVILHYQDLELAHTLILEANNEKDLINQNNVSTFVNDMYNKFNSGIKSHFNYPINKSKTELVILYNELNLVISKLRKESYILANHINFRMKDLTEAIMVKDSELSNLLKLNNVFNVNVSIDKKLTTLNHKNKE